MAVTKEDLKINGSDYYKRVFIRNNQGYYLTQWDDMADPGRIALKMGQGHDAWRLMMRYNKIVDPFTEITLGIGIEAPSQDDLQAIKKY